MWQRKVLFRLLIVKVYKIEGIGGFFGGNFHEKMCDFALHNMET